MCCESEAVLQRREHNDWGTAHLLPQQETKGVVSANLPSQQRTGQWEEILRRVANDPSWEGPGIPLLTGKLCILR